MPAPPDAASEAIRAGLTFLESCHTPDGGFPFWRREGDEAWSPCHPLFATCAVLLAVGSVLSPRRREEALGFVRRSRRPDGLWIFDPSMEVPADADDTACALAVLSAARRADDPTADADVLRRFWRPGVGPFRTWLPETGPWADTARDDPVVNCNVLLALQRLGVAATDEETGAVVRLLRQSGGRSRYYCSPTSVGYAARRAGLTGIVDGPAPARGSSASAALATAEWLLVAGRRAPEVINALLAWQRPDGSWPAEPWCTGQGIATVWGSEAVSTSIVLEALMTAADSSA